MDSHSARSLLRHAKDNSLAKITIDLQKYLVMRTVDSHNFFMIALFPKHAVDFHSGGRATLDSNQQATDRPTAEGGAGPNTPLPGAETQLTTTSSPSGVDEEAHPEPSWQLSTIARGLSFGG